MKSETLDFGAFTLLYTTYIKACKAQETDILCRKCFAADDFTFSPARNFLTQENMDFI